MSAYGTFWPYGCSQVRSAFQCQTGLIGGSSAKATTRPAVSHLVSRFPAAAARQQPLGMATTVTYEHRRASQPQDPGAG